MSSLARGLAAVLIAKAFAALALAGASNSAAAADDSALKADEASEEVGASGHEPIYILGGEEFDFRMTVTGSVSRAVLGWNDGAATGAYLVDPSGTSIDVEGEYELGAWTLGGAVSTDFVLAPSDEVDQFEPWGIDNRAEISNVYGRLGHERLGTIMGGLVDSATDGIDSIDLSESDVLADAGVSGWNGHFLIRPVGEATGTLRWGDFVDGTLAGDTRYLFAYETPDVAGFVASASAGHDFWDAALRYAGEVHGLELAAGIGLWRDQLAEDVEPVDDAGWGGSIAGRHAESGVNLAFNFGTVSHTPLCTEPGAVSDMCRGNDRFYYVKGGVVRDLIDAGSTSFYGEFYRGVKNPNDSDTDTLDELLVADGFGDEELARTAATVLGFGVVQRIERHNAEVFVGYRHYSLVASLIDGGGPVAARAIETFDAVMSGAKIGF